MELSLEAASQYAAFRDQMCRNIVAALLVPVSLMNPSPEVTE